MDIKIIASVFAGAVLFFTFLYAVKKSCKPFKRAVTSALSGILALVAVNAAGLFTGVYIPVSILSICISAAGGIPAVTVMLIIDTFFR